MKYQTDKVYTHHYETIYEKYLSHYRDTSIRLLEIGLGCGMDRGVGASAKTWREYLGSKAIIHYIEFDEKCGKKWESTVGKQLDIIVHYGSQEDVKFLQQFMSTMQPFDIIIDDGGHTMNQQKVSLMTLVPLVRSGGFYVIEDLETSYISSYGGNYLSPTSTISLIKTFVDEVQAESPRKTIPIIKKIFSFEVSDGICIFTIK